MPAFHTWISPAHIPWFWSANGQTNEQKGGKERRDGEDH